MAASGKIDINTASASELEQLPGLNRRKAYEIVRDRERRGPFTRSADVLRVNGIGDRTYESMASMIFVEGESADDAGAADAGAPPVDTVHDEDRAALRAEGEVTKLTAWSTLVGLLALMIIFVVLPFPAYAKSLLAFWVLAVVATVARLSKTDGPDVLAELQSRRGELANTFLITMVIGAILALVVFEQWWHDMDVSYSVTQVWLLTLLVMAIIWLVTWISTYALGNLKAAKKLIAPWTTWFFAWAIGYGGVWLLIGIAIAIEEGE